MYFNYLTYLNSIRNLSCFKIKNYKSKVFYSNVKISNKNNYVFKSVKNHGFPVSVFQVRYKITSSNSNVNCNTFYKKYFISLTLGTIIGTITGIFYLKVHKIDKYESTLEIVPNKSILNNFPMMIHLYQFDYCPYCSQIRAYLDYFGFSYKLTEVDSYANEEIANFSRAKSLPIIVIENKVNKMRWYLTNATSILSALESIRNEKPINFSQILNQYLPILKGNTIDSTKNSFKYHVSNSDLNSIEWRKWINNTAIPTFKLNAISNTKDLFETLDFYSTKSNKRYSLLKYYYVYLNNFFKSVSQYSSLAKQLDQNKTPRENLHCVIKEWENGLNGKKFISGSNKPNLADISMYGSIRAFEGCALFRESISQHDSFKEWYERMQKVVLKGYEEYQVEKENDFFFKLFSVEELETLLKTQNLELTETNASVVEANKKLQIENEKEILSNKPDKSTRNLALFRILTTNYLIHVLAFSYASLVAK